jgi:hypothetical protein
VASSPNVKQLYAGWDVSIKHSCDFSSRLRDGFCIQTMPAERPRIKQGMCECVHTNMLVPSSWHDSQLHQQVSAPPGTQHNAYIAAKHHLYAAGSSALDVKSCSLQLHHSSFH